MEHHQHPLRLVHHYNTTEFCNSQSALRTQLRRGYILIKWMGLSEVEAIWKREDEFRAAHPQFQLKDELFPEGGRDLMVGRVYERRDKSNGCHENTLPRPAVKRLGT